MARRRHLRHLTRQPHARRAVYDDQAAAIGAHREHGTLTGWQDAVAALDPYPVAKISAYAGFAAPLLQLLAVDSFTLDVSGPSTRGKTTAAKIGLSVWADPSKKGDGLFSWRTSLIAVEKRLNICRGLPVVIDETHAAEVSSVEIQAGLFDMDGPGIPARTPDAR